jgi:hypothetical protein
LVLPEEVVLKRQWSATEEIGPVQHSTIRVSGTKGWDVSLFQNKLKTHSDAEKCYKKHAEGGGVLDILLVN